MTEATPGPWTIGRFGKIFSGDKQRVDNTLLLSGVALTTGNHPFEDEARANAELIVKAVNAHDNLVAAADAALTWWHSIPSHVLEHEPEWVQMCRDAAALTKAESYE